MKRTVSAMTKNTRTNSRLYAVEEKITLKDLQQKKPSKMNTKGRNRTKNHEGGLSELQDNFNQPLGMCKRYPRTGWGGGTYLKK